MLPCSFYPWAVYCEGPAAFIRCKKEEGEEEGEEEEEEEEEEEQKHLFVVLSIWDNLCIAMDAPVTGV